MVAEVLQLLMDLLVLKWRTCLQNNIGTLTHALISFSACSLSCCGKRYSSLACTTVGTKLLVKSVCETALKTSFWAPTFVPEFEYMYVPRKPIVNLPIRLKGNLKYTSSNLLSPSGAENKDISAALQTLLTGVRLRLQHRLLYPMN